ncbi:ketimine reductase mu-crystallin-like [Clytia hemisphaerica]|uniref:Ketimine reductase mu-crystallin n=1 Tax=Clytia hemisphaerica TaxID=252671 RepID=A0A7M5XGW4_9CNID
MKPLFLDGEQVEQHLPLLDLLDGIEKSFVNYSNKIEGLIHPQRLVLNVQNNDLFFVKPVVSTPDKTICTKLLTLFPENEAKYQVPSHQAIVTVFDSDTGSLQAVMDGVAVTDLRTAAASAIARKHLAPRGNSNILAIVGTGHQAVSHVKLFRAVSGYKEIRVCSRSNPQRAQQFAKQWGIKAASSVQEGVRDADIVVTVTKSSAQPVVLYEWLKPNALVVIVGSPISSQRDVDSSTMLNSIVVADSKPGAMETSGDVIQSGCEVHGELGEVIGGKMKVGFDKMRVFKSSGLAVQDLVAGKIVVQNYRKAIREC